MNSSPLPLVLLVDDDPEIARLVIHHLGQAGWPVEHASDAESGLRVLRERRPAVVLLDLGLPDLDGLDVCRAIRADPATAHVAIIIVTAKGQELDRVLGLEMGADDYLSKPFSTRELQARIRAVLRRAPSRPSVVIRCSGLQIDPVSRRVSAGGIEVPLRAREFDLLLCLAKEPDRVWRRDELLSAVWGYEHPNDLLTRTIDVHVRRLRLKLGDCGRHLETLKGVGYRFASHLP